MAATMTATLSTAEVPPLSAAVFVLGAAYASYQLITGFRDPKNWTISHRPYHQDPINNPPKGFDNKKFPPGWNGPVKWIGVGFLGYKLYNSFQSTEIPPKTIVPRDNTTVVGPYNPYK